MRGSRELKPPGHRTTRTRFASSMSIVLQFKPANSGQASIAVGFGILLSIEPQVSAVSNEQASHCVGRAYHIVFRESVQVVSEYVDELKRGQRAVIWAASPLSCSVHLWMVWMEGSFREFSRHMQYNCRAEVFDVQVLFAAERIVLSANTDCMSRRCWSTQ